MPTRTPLIGTCQLLSECTALMRAQAPGVDSTKRVITVGDLAPSTEGGDCTSLLGKFRVTEFRAVSWFTAGQDNYDALAALDTTAVTSYFYIGAHMWK